MASIKNIAIKRNAGIRLAQEVDIYWFDVEYGKEYDLVRFSINELNANLFWKDSLYVKAGMSYENICKLCDKVARRIPSKRIAEYQEIIDKRK